HHGRASPHPPQHRARKRRRRLRDDDEFSLGERAAADRPHAPAWRAGRGDRMTASVFYYRVRGRHADGLTLPSAVAGPWNEIEAPSFAEARAAVASMSAATGTTYEIAAE